MLEIVFEALTTAVPVAVTLAGGADSVMVGALV